MESDHASSDDSSDEAPGLHLPGLGHPQHQPTIEQMPVSPKRFTSSTGTRKTSGSSFDSLQSTYDRGDFLAALSK